MTRTLADAPQSNWLPAPAGEPFTLNLRLYVPKPEVLSGGCYVSPNRALRLTSRAHKRQG